MTKTKSISDPELRLYLNTPPPSLNPYIAKAVAKDPFLSADASQVQSSIANEGGEPSNSKKHKPKRIPRSILVKYLLHERTEAVNALHLFLAGFDVASTEGLPEVERAKVENAMKFVKEHCEFY